jgi:hypothetical protein
MRAFFTSGVSLLALSAAYAQAPSPAQMGITQPPVTFLEVLDQNKLWQPVGSGGVRIIGLDASGGTDVTAKLDAILASSTQCWFLPAGTYQIRDEVTGRLGGCLKGDSSRNTIFAINSATFNMSARGAFFFPPTGGQSFTLMDVGFEYTQPQPANRAAAVNFPPAIYAQSAGRMKLERIYFGAANVCLDARGNAGGAFIHDIECGAYGHGMYWDGTLDTVRIVNWHHWPFGVMNIGNTPLHDLYNDGQVECMNLGSVEDLKAVNVGCFQASLHITSHASPSLTMSFDNLSMDGYSSTITMDAGRVTIANTSEVKMTKRSQARKRQLYGVDSDGVKLVLTSPANTVAPTIAGTPKVGVPTAVNIGTWTGLNTGKNYQWRIAGANVAGATGNTYTPVAGDATKALSCSINVSNSAGSSGATSAGVTVVP